MAIRCGGTEFWKWAHGKQSPLRGTKTNETAQKKWDLVEAFEKKK